MAGHVPAMTVVHVNEDTLRYLTSYIRLMFQNNGLPCSTPVRLA